MAGGASKDSGPASWQDALSEASQAIAAGLAAPDADVKFGLALMGAMAEHGKKQQPQGQPGQPGGAGVGAPGLAGGGETGSLPAGAPTGPAGGGQPNQAMGSAAGPGAPTQPGGGAGGPGGVSQGLSPNPDELRRVLADVAGK